MTPGARLGACLRKRFRAGAALPLRRSLPSLRSLLMLLSLLPAAAAAQSGTASAGQAGQRKAQACAVCHGALGLANTPDAPHLAGQPAIYLAAQLRAYRSGERRHEVMAVIAKPLSDGDIADLAAWYASIKVEAKAPGP
jgi:cytochrome c553